MYNFVSSFLLILILDSLETVHMLCIGFMDLQTVYIRSIDNGIDKFKSYLKNFFSFCAFGKYIFFDIIFLK